MFDLHKIDISTRLISIKQTKTTQLPINLCKWLLLPTGNFHVHWICRHNTNITYIPVYSFYMCGKFVHVTMRVNVFV